MNYSNEQQPFKLILNNIVFPITSDFHFLFTIDYDIYKTLKAKNVYNVKSNVPEDIFSFFIQYLLYNKVPNFTEDNIIYYSELSEEFDIMKDLIELFEQQTLIIQRQIYKNKELKNKLTEKKDTLKQKMEKYHKIVHILFTNIKIDNYFRSDHNKNQLFQSINSEDAEMVNLLTLPHIEKNGFTFIYDKESQTAGLLRYDGQDENVKIPRSIQIDSNDFLIKTVHKGTFSRSQNVKSIQFSEDSEIQTIDKEAFCWSSVQSISIPKSVKIIGESAFALCFGLNCIEFSIDSQLESIEKYAFFAASLEEVVIPRNLRKIGEFAFSDCRCIQKVEISKDSELVSIEKDAFAACSIDDLVIPSKVEKLEDGWCQNLKKLKRIEISENNTNFIYYENDFILGKSDTKSDKFDVLLFSRRNIREAIIPDFIKKISPYAFQKCTKLEKIEFSENSELESIEDKAFSDSSIESLTIPSTVVKLSDEWSHNITKLMNIKIMPNNKNIIYYENKFILTKTNPKFRNFDVLSFSRRDIKKAKIPDFIQKVASYSFDNCFELQSIEFSNDSKLKILDRSAFSLSTIKMLSIPKSVTIIGQNCFGNCDQLKTVQFQSNSNLKTICEYAFMESSIETITIPDRLSQICECAFACCEKFRKIKFSDNSKLSEIGEGAFSNSSLESISIPASVSKIDDNAFIECYYLQIVEILENSQLKSINKSVFEGSVNLLIMIPVNISDSISKC